MFSLRKVHTWSTSSSHFTTVPNNRRCVVSGNYALMENIDVSNTHRRFGRRCDRKLHYDSCLPATDTTRRPLETVSLACMILCASSASVIVSQPYNSTVIVCKLDFRKHHTTQFHTHLPPFTFHHRNLVPSPLGRAAVIANVVSTVPFF